MLGKPLSVIYINNPTLGGFFRMDKDCRSGFLCVNTVGDPKKDPEAAKNAAADISEQRLIEFVRAGVGVPDLPVKIDGLARWRATSDVARKFRDGRVFLAGDAAHLMPPNGGFGGNTGIHDAHNLAWKLALVLKGLAGPGLLDTYEVERKPVGKFTVEQAYTRYVTRTAPYLGAKDYEPPANDFNIELGYLYRSSAIHSEDGDGKVHDDPRLTFGRPGSRAPHLWLERDGKQTLHHRPHRTIVRSARRPRRRGLVPRRARRREEIRPRARRLPGRRRRSRSERRVCRGLRLVGFGRGADTSGRLHRLACHGRRGRSPNRNHPCLRCHSVEVLTAADEPCEHGLMLRLRARCARRE